MINVLSKRLQNLEEKFAFQEQTIDALNDVILDQQTQINDLEEQVQKLRTLLSSSQDQVGIGKEPPPPHITNVKLRQGITLARKTIVHKGYHGTIEVNTDDFSLHGTILFLDEEITYKGETFEDLEAAFSKAVNAHIKGCLDSGQEPPFSEE